MHWAVDVCVGVARAGITWVILSISLAGAAQASDPHGGAPTAKPVIASADDLPRFEYPLGTPSKVYQDDALFAALLDAVERDTRGVVEGYDLQDAATRRAALLLLADIAALRGNAARAMSLREQSKVGIDNLAVREIGSGLGLEMDALMSVQTVPDTERAAALEAALRARIVVLPWAEIEDAVKAWKANRESNSPNLCLGTVMLYDAPSVQTGVFGSDAAGTIIRCRRDSDLSYPYKSTTVRVLRDMLANHRQPAIDIWKARRIDLHGRDGLTPVVVAIWDSGLDPQVYPHSLWTNPGESQNGIDDDRNGYVDDLHGIRFGLFGEGVEPGLIRPLGNAASRWPEARRRMKGQSDIRADIDSSEAEMVRAEMAELRPEALGAYDEEQAQFLSYAHGTHVAGIAADGNPAVRLLSVAFAFPYQIVPPPLDEARAESLVRFFRRSVDYMKANDVRVANMSWGLLPSDVEASFEANAIGASAEERKALAERVFGRLREGLRDALASAPGILFIEAAGNTGTDLEFTGDIPGTLGSPNVIVVGAADQAGRQTAYSVRGKGVDVYANGHQITGLVPGGDAVMLSGASLSAPQVTNLAAALLAIAPDLSVTELKALIVEGAEVPDSVTGIRRLDPRGSLSRLDARMAR
jgi:hypothetical protein